MENQNIVIAAVTNDGVTISPHFGRAKYYEVLFVENGKVVKRERREKVTHHHSHNEQHQHHWGGEGRQHGFDEASRQRHFNMAEAIKDCQILLSRGMGAGAYQNLFDLNIKPIITDIRNIDDAVQALINGTIVNRIDKLH
jgi:predicted Fe-Mo cluster-binding NifX family protein